MTPRSIQSHLKPYSILASRRTTIAHAFASALAPFDPYIESDVINALIALGQTDLPHLVCVYCSLPATTWDHLVGLVKDGQLNGYGHQIGNLVPCCGPCNFRKGGKDFHEFVRAGKGTDEEKTDLIRKLDAHLQRATRVSAPAVGSQAAAAKRKFDDLQRQILDLMKQADEQAAIVRQLIRVDL
ncbi:HNH endonuclease [Paraburkholderia sp. A1RI-2L]|uniref:HNH endonuclease n=1 Tax=Paraburkholderia sp. A1RI-2L TaxID=3028367 RepID=UPI003B79E1F9